MPFPKSFSISISLRQDRNPVLIILPLQFHRFFGILYLSFQRKTGRKAAGDMSGDCIL
jgi:hypothetical protein